MRTGQHHRAEVRGESQPGELLRADRLRELRATRRRGAPRQIGPSGALRHRQRQHPSDAAQGVLQGLHAAGEGEADVARGSKT
jgi:hypothetical protein